MVAFTTFTFTLALAASVLALPKPDPNPLSPDPAGTKNIGNGKGGQFITGACLSNADCASACCATLGSSGICSGPGAAFQQGKTGCGFNSGAAAPPAAQAATPAPPPASAPASGSGGSGLTPDPAGTKNIGNGKGGQFITGACLSNADCASGCCAVLGSGGICSGPAVSFAQGKQGCGFTASGSAAAAPPAAQAATPAPPPASAPASGSGGSGLTPDPAGAKNVGNGKGGQFITGACLSNADCASGCCAVLGSGGICSGPAVSFAQGKQGCGFQGSA